MNEMQAVVVREVGRFEIATVARPVPAAGEVLIQVALAGMCRTDLKLIDVGHRDLTLPRIPAEEVVGTIIEAGDAAASAWIGKRVYVYPGTSCGDCEYCKMGAGNLCRGMQIMGFHRDGGFAEYVKAPVASLIELPADLEFGAAVFAEPLSCCLNALELGRVAAGDRVGIWGAGPAGTLLARAASAAGAVVTVIEPDPDRRKRAGALAAVADGMQFDVVIPAVGSVDAYRDALNALAPRGRIVAFSGLQPDETQGLLDVNQLHYLEQTCVGAYGCSYQHSVEAVEAIHAERVPVRDLVSHRLLLSDMDEALELVRHRKSMKILIFPNEAQREAYHG
jgi:L-iditol 2-dehydrogenase